MASINQVNVLGTVYDIEDASAQQSITAIQGDIAEINTDLGNKAPLIEPTVGPSPVATFTDGAAGMPMEVTVALDPIQAGSGDPAPDNVREISGRTGVGVHRAVENLLEITLETQTVNGVTFTNNGDGSIHVSGTASAQVYLAVGATEELAEDSYVWSGNPAGASSATYFLTRNNGSGNFYTEVGSPYTASGVQAPRIYVRSGVSLDVVFRPQIIRASELESLSVTFPDPPGTVYGGTLTVNRDGTGKLVVDREYYAFDGSEGWLAFDTAENLYYLNAQSYGNLADAYTDGTENDFAISNRYVQRKYSGVLSAYNGQFAIGRPTGAGFTKRIVVKDTACATVDDLKASLATTPMQLVYRINTPITYDLTAEQVGQITSVKGVNYVWSAGQVEVTYAADTKLYIDGKIASLQATILENISNA